MKRNGDRQFSIILLLVMSFGLFNDAYASARGGINLKDIQEVLFLKEAPSERYDTQYDSLVAALYNRKIMGLYNNSVSEFIVLDSAYQKQEVGKSLDTIYKERLDLIPSVIKLPYNSVVRSYIDRYVRSNTMSRILGLSLYYMPYFEKELLAEGLPAELKMLAIVESALNPRAVSPSGTAGLWQFTYSTGRLYGLEISSFVDERLDPIQSTKAVCKYFKALYTIYKDWTLVLAAYNCGPGNVNKALQRVPNANSYWDIYDLLPAATRGFVPAFIGVTYAYKFHKAHHVKVTMPPHPIVTDTITITNRMLHFKQISTTIDLSIETIKALNPMYKLNIIPAKSRDYHLILPLEKVSQYIESEGDIHSKAAIYLNDYAADHSAAAATANNAPSGKNGARTHTVKKGDVLGAIAKKYKVSTANLMKWNNIKNAKALKIGQKLKIGK